MYQITLIKGDGIGPEVSLAAKKVIDATGLDIQWDIVNAGEQVYKETGKLIPNDVYESIEKNKVALKGPITTPIGSGFRSINVHLRKKYDLFANIRPIQSTKGQGRYKNLDFTIFRENTEGLYIGIEKSLSDEEKQAIKKVTLKGSERIIKQAFEYAQSKGLSKVTVAHKANILKITDGMFLDVARKVASNYKEIHLEEVIIDHMCMLMVMKPSDFQVIVTMNLYGDILSDLGAGLIGGLGLVPGANIGDDIAIFEAVHGSAPDIALQNKANPTALIKSGIMMLRYLKADEAANRIEKALDQVYSKGELLTVDCGGTATTEAFTNEIIKHL